MNPVAKVDRFSSYTAFCTAVAFDKEALTQFVTKAREAARRGQKDVATHLYEQSLLICEETNEFDVYLTCEIIEELSTIYASEGKSNQAAFLRETARKMLARAA